jgi:hypothetical protein
VFLDELADYISDDSGSPKPGEALLKDFKVTLIKVQGVLPDRASRSFHGE